MKEPAVGPEHAHGLSQHVAPVRHDVHDSREDDRVEARIRKREPRALRSHDADGRSGHLAAERLEHLPGWIEGRYATAALGERQRDTAGAGADVEKLRAGMQSGSVSETPREVCRNNLAVAAIVDVGVRREIDCAQLCFSKRTA